MNFPYGKIALAAITVIVLAGCQQDAGSSDSFGSSANSDRPVNDTADGAPSDGATPVHGTVAGRVLDQGDTPVAGAVVQPRSLDVPAKPIPELLVTTDGNGAYRWSLAPGRYEFSVTPGAGTSKPPVRQTVAVVAGQTRTVDFTLP